MVRMLPLMLTAALLAACNSNPPPRPMPQPSTQPTTHPTAAQPQQEQPRQQAAQPTQPERTAQGSQTSPAPTQQAPAQPAAGGAAAQPEWYRDGVFRLEGVEHRAFAVTAGDVRDARSQAMLLAYEAYPKGHVAAHEAIRLADGSWRFYVLMAAGG